MAKYLVLILLLIPFSGAYAHCQIPCGIYDDSRIFDELEQHVETIEKSMKAISETDNVHDITRWTINKEEHAQKIQDIASEYFLAQRVKPDTPDYMKHLLRLHQMIINAMKTKQTVDLADLENLKSTISHYEKLYYAPHEHKEDKAQ
ncbi:MAG: superoxide dismutase [Ni] [Bdellovibrionales bacterium]